jgi:hypothetical protein
VVGEAFPERDKSPLSMGGLGLPEGPAAACWVRDGPAAAVTRGASLLTALPSALLVGFLAGAGTEGFRGGVMAFSATLDADAWVGRIIRARKLSSTCFSFLVGGYSLAGCFGGGPKLGRGLLMVELCLLSVLAPAALVAVVATVETLPRLGERPRGSAACMLPLALESDCLPGLTLEPEAVVCVVRRSGSRTGRVGDLGFGLTNAPPAGDG